MLSQTQKDKVFQGGEVNRLCIMLLTGQVKWMLRNDHTTIRFNHFNVISDFEKSSFSNLMN